MTFQTRAWIWILYRLPVSPSPRPPISPSPRLLVPPSPRLPPPHAVCNRRPSSSNSFSAATGMTVPGPKIMAAPCSLKNA